MSTKLILALVILARISIGILLVFTGYHKIYDAESTTTDNPASIFFNCLYETGLYLKFIGVTEIITGLLLISQRFALVGEILAFAIFINTLMITIALYPYFGLTMYLNFAIVVLISILLFLDRSKLWLLIQKSRY